MKKITFRILTLVILALPIYLTLFANKNPIRANITTYKDQVTNAQLSFFARLSGYNGSSLRVGGTAPNLFVTNLTIGDTVAVAAGVGSSIFTVKDIGNTLSIDLNAAVGVTVPGGYIVATRSGIHTVTFTPWEFGGSGEHWQFLIKTTNVLTVAGTTPYFMDGMPDQDGFDIGGSTPSCTTTGCYLRPSDIKCPYTGGTASVGTTVVITADIGNSNAAGSYNVINCSYSAATSKIGVGGSFVVGTANGPQLINPSSSATRAFGVSDIYNYAIRQLDAGGSQVDIAFGKIAVDDSVRITATVDPTLTFIISANGTIKCGAPVAVSPAFATPNALSFGPLLIESTANNLSQLLSVVTNSLGGYVLQAFENNVLTMVGGSTTLPNIAAASNGAGAVWPSVSASSGFGYSMQVGTTRAGAVLGIGATANYRSFGIGYANAATIMNNPNPSADSANVCYRISATLYQPAGEYENSVSYIATATF